MSEWPPFLDSVDLAPGDQVPHPDLPDGLRLEIIDSADHPAYDQVFEMLMEQFGDKREMETREVIEDRLSWQGNCILNGRHMLYHLMALFQGEHCVGVRDHTAIIDPKQGPVVVHLSHVLVHPEWRRRGLVTILRTLPVSTARELASQVGRPDASIVLFCEMDPLDMEDPPNRIRRLSYEKANFKGIPSGLGYLQPDFREPAVIEEDACGTLPVELDLLFRFVGNEAQSVMDRDELILAIGHIYTMYATGMSHREMQPCYSWLAGFEQESMRVFPLFPPTQTRIR